MRRTRRRDTECERLLRSALHRRGIRFRIDRPLPFLPRRRADIVIASRRVAVFVDGCFWHGCPVHGTQPKANALWWRMKIEGNAARDRDTDRRLREAGWMCLRVWEHEPAEEAADRIHEAIQALPASVEGRGRTAQPRKRAR